MSFVLYAYMLETYGSPRLTMPQLAEVLQRSPKSVANEASRSGFPVRTYLEAGKRWADIRDVIEYLDRARENESTPA